MLVNPPSEIVERPILHLSGAKLRAALATLLAAAETVGGVERFVAALHIKSQAFQERLGQGRAETLELHAFDEIAQLMPTVRRRVGGLIDRHSWPLVRAAIVKLLRDAHVPGSADARIATFENELKGTVSQSGQTSVPARNANPASRTNDRFLRDFAAEILHNVLPEHYPLMTRWMWDANTNTGVIREIWHDPTSGDDTDHIVIDVPDTHETFLVLREELSQFLSKQGIFRDMLLYIDVLSAQIYASYINSQGGAWLKTEFASEGDPLEHTRRILGLDARGMGLRSHSKANDTAASKKGVGLLPSEH